MKYQILDETIGKRFVFNNEDLSKLTIKLIHLLTCFNFPTEKEEEGKTSFFVFTENGYDDELLEYMLDELESLGFQLIQE